MTDALDKAIPVGDAIEEVLDPSTEQGSDWLRGGGVGWERTMRTKADVENAFRRLDGAKYAPVLRCVACGGQTRQVFHDGDGEHLIESRCTMCGKSFWPHSGNGTMETGRHVGWPTNEAGLKAAMVDARATYLLKHYAGEPGFARHDGCECKREE
jgi:hypothetical protein